MIPIPQFSPKNSLAGVVAGLFQNNEPGVWYDPSDFSMMFQDAAGTTPVTAVEQPVGLMLDKSKGLVLGPELVTNGDFSNGTTGWTAVTVGAAFTGSVLTFNRTAGNPDPIAENSGTVQAGKTYALTFDVVSVSSATNNLGVRVGAGGVTYHDVGLTSSGRKQVVFTPSASGTIQFYSGGVAPLTTVIDNISVRELPGNHAYQTTTTSRPVLSARYNLLTKTEQFDDAVWVKGRSSVAATNTVVAPDGTLTAEKLVDSTDNATHRAYQVIIGAVIATYTFSVYVKAAEQNRVALAVTSTNETVRHRVIFELTGEGTGATNFGSGSFAIQAVGNGWYRCSVTGTTISGDAGVSGFIYTTDSTGISYVGTGTKGIYIWGASLVPANQAHLPYQRVNTATDYDSDPAKFKPYLLFDGIDDWLVTPTITPGTDKVQVFAGVRKLSDAAVGILLESSTSIGTNNGVIGVAAPLNTSGSTFSFASKGTVFTGWSVSGAPFAAPSTVVLTGVGDIAADAQILRLNGAQIQSLGTVQGTGNYLAYPLYIGRRGGTTFPLNGHLYSLIVRFGNNLPIETIEKTEEYMNLKTAAIDWRDVTDSSSFRWNSATASPNAE